ncbi:MAG: MtrB/PioB family outer membrane beta-barrel protein [Acidobacteriota bacterium]|nr:MtrB/PioB family outer membrane beta-barrel protein [Acidobacteriota bacterium]
MIKLMLLCVILGAVEASGQTAPPAPQASPVEVSGSIASGVLGLDNSTNSAKLTEYRDLRNNFFVPDMTVSMADRAAGWYFDLSGVNVSRDDQTIRAEAGSFGRWRLKADWGETPHNFSNKAVTPYTQRTPGLFTVPATVPITFKKLATAAADTAGVLASDDLIAAYQANFLAPTPLAMQTNAGSFALRWLAIDNLALDVVYDRRDKSGSRPTYGPIGDRPPRTLNIQLAEPVDYNTNEVTLAAEHQGGRYQIRGEYQFSDFANQVDTMQWQNIYATGQPGATYDVWDRSVSVFGVRPLSPDNRYHNLTGMFGTNLPKDSRLTATVAYGLLEQNETLLPYSYNNDQLAVRTLPRVSAEAAINTLNFVADYTITPTPKLNLRAYYRSYDLNNDTPSSNWQYVTQDTSNLNGTVSYLNKRVSLPYAWSRRNAGVDATWRLPARTSLLVGFERESMDRDHREADTAENIFRATLRTRGARWATFEARALFGARDGGDYHNTVTREGYWYSQSDGVDNNNPALTFDNHPDMRRYDVSDRMRQQFDVRANFTPRDLVSLSAYARYRHDDFDSDVQPSQPLLGTGLAEQNAVTPGNQLGRLDDKRTRFGVDAFTEVKTGLSFHAFLNFDQGTALDRSLEFQENNKANPSAVATAELGPWTRAGSQWMAKNNDETWSAGVGTTWQIAPEKVTLIADYTASLAAIDIDYSGFGVTNFNGTPFPANHQFAFSSPSTVSEDWHVVNLRLEIPVREVILVTSYSYENYALDDWAQASAAPWVESVGADTLLRDTSRSFQWGNRLFNLGTYLAPRYVAHIGFVGFRYRF